MTFLAQGAMGHVPQKLAPSVNVFTALATVGKYFFTQVTQFGNDDIIKHKITYQIKLYH